MRKKVHHCSGDLCQRPARARPSVDVDDSHDEDIKKDYDDDYIVLTRKIEVAEAARAAYSKPLPAGISDIVCKIVYGKILQNTAKILYAISNLTRFFLSFG